MGQETFWLIAAESGQSAYWFKNNLQSDEPAGGQQVELWQERQGRERPLDRWGLAGLWPAV